MPRMTRGSESAAATSCPSSSPTAPRDAPDYALPKSAWRPRSREAQAAHAHGCKPAQTLRPAWPQAARAQDDRPAGSRRSGREGEHHRSRLPADPQPARVRAGLQRPSRLHPNAGDHRRGALDRLARRAAARADDPRRPRRARRGRDRRAARRRARRRRLLERPADRGGRVAWQPGDRQPRQQRPREPASRSAQAARQTRSRPLRAHATRHHKRGSALRFTANDSR